MTSSVVSTSVTTTQDVAAAGDDLLVTSAGSIIVTTSGAYGVDSTANEQEITIDGLVYSIDDYSNTGVNITGVETVLDVNGQIQGDTGVDVDKGTFDRISVASQGAIGGGSAGVVFAGNFDDEAATDNILDNAGDMSGTVGVLAEDGGGDVFDNSGQIAGEDGIQLDGNVATETVENSGTITGNANGGTVGSTITTDSSAGIEVVNSGLLTDDGTNETNVGPAAVLYFDDASGTTSTIDNTGSISGAGYVIQSFDDILDISNSGTVHGGLYSVATVDVDNSGVWKDQAGSAPVFVLDGGTNSVTNAAGGVIDGAISIAHSHDTLNNAGSIDGAITLTSGSDTIANAGSVDGPITTIGATDTNSLTNSGTITGAVALSGGYNAVDNSGLIDGAVTIAHSEDTFSNAGTIDGNVALTAGGDTFTNTGTIDGEVMFWSSGGDNHDTLINTGTIHGAVTLGGGDTFDASGNFGQVTFDDFVAGSGSTHDTIQFAANDFSTFSQVQAASTQQGSDVVIRLDASDAITLNNVTLSSLVSADFSFV